jgi:hypothetical protein
MIDRYRKQVDATISEAFESIMESDSQYAPQVNQWASQLEKVVYVIERILSNTIDICLCYDLQPLASSIVKNLEKFLMQLCYHIGQFSNKKFHMGIPNLLTINQTVQMDDTQLSLYESKFKWQNVFEYITLNHTLLRFFARLKALDQ